MRWPCMGRRHVRAVGFILLLLVVMWAVKLWCAPRPVVERPESGWPAVPASVVGQPVFVVNFGWHTGVVVPAALLDPVLPALHARFPGAAYYEIGWGDAGFYQAPTISVSLAIPALLWPTPSVVHVVAISHPERHYRHARRSSLCLDSGQLTRLRDGMAAAFDVSAGAPESLGRGLYGNSSFYRGAGQYQLFFTCNSWTASRLADVGVPITPEITYFARGVSQAVEDALASGLDRCPSP